MPPPPYAIQPIMNKAQQNFSLSKYANTATANNIIETTINLLLLFFFSLNSIVLPLNKIEQLKNKKVYKYFNSYTFCWLEGEIIYNKI